MPVLLKKIGELGNWKLFENWENVKCGVNHEIKKIMKFCKLGRCVKLVLLVFKLFWMINQQRIYAILKTLNMTNTVVSFYF